MGVSRKSPSAFAFSCVSGLVVVPPAIPAESSFLIESSPCHWPPRMKPPVPDRAWGQEIFFRKHKPCHCALPPQIHAANTAGSVFWNPALLVCPQTEPLLVAPFLLSTLILKPPTSLSAVIFVWIWKVPGAHHAHLLRLSLQSWTTFSLQVLCVPQAMIKLQLLLQLRPWPFQPRRKALFQGSHYRSMWEFLPSFFFNIPIGQLHERCIHSMTRHLFEASLFTYDSTKEDGQSLRSPQGLRSREQPGFMGVPVKAHLPFDLWLSFHSFVFFLPSLLG